MIDRILNNRILSHVLFWLFVITIYSLIGSYYFIPWYEPLINKIGYLPGQIIVAYTLIYVLLPKFLFRQKYLSFLVYLLITFYVAAVLSRVLKIYFYEPIINPSLPPNSLVEILTNPVPLFYQYILWLCHIPLIMLLIKYIKAYFNDEQRLQKLQKEKVEAELSFLKAQIHPHFLFNTLNNLYTLTLDKSDHAPTVVKKLSSMIQYMLHYCSQPFVLITKEIELIQDYIDLELLRYGDRLQLIFQHTQDDKNAKIAPLILLSVVENAFKHGASGDPGQPKIQISLRVEKGQLHFSVFNTKSKFKPMDRSNYTKGIGSGNIKRQLELIYPQAYLLKINDRPDTYEVLLTINLDEIIAVGSITAESPAHRKGQKETSTPLQTISI